MPLAAAAWDARALRRVTAAAIAAALQGVFYWLILHEAIGPTDLPAAMPLEVTILQAAKRLEPATPARERQRPRQVARRRVQRSAQPVTLPGPVERARHPPIDWSRALQGEVHAPKLRAPAQKLRFGFPRRSAPVPAAPEFGWDYASTHRLEALPQGGMLLNLNDRCAIVIYGFIFPFCRIGRIPVNGHLFDHMHDRRAGDPQR